MRRIIGIAGLIGSGKDTVANHLINEHNFQRIKFADKLKDGVAAIFDWPRDLLEGDTDESSGGKGCNLCVGGRAGGYDTSQWLDGACG